MKKIWRRKHQIYLFGLKQSMFGGVLFYHHNKLWCWHNVYLRLVHEVVSQNKKKTLALAYTQTHIFPSRLLDGLKNNNNHKGFSPNKIPFWAKARCGCVQFVNPFDKSNGNIFLMQFRFVVNESNKNIYYTLAH